MIKGGTNPARLAETQAHWQAIGELLNSGQYERAAEILRRTQATSEQAGEAILVHILDAAGRICLACNQCHAQAEWHRDAGEEAAQREQELRRRLDAILDLVDGRGPPPETEETQVELPNVPVAETAPPSLGPPEPAHRPTLAQCIQRMLGRGLAILSSERRKTNVSPSSRKNPGGQRPPTLVVYCLGAFRVYQNAVAILAPSAQGLATLRRHLRRSRALQAISEGDRSLSEGDRRELSRRLAEAEEGIPFTLLSAFRYCIKAEGQDVRVLDMGIPAPGEGTTISERVHTFLEDQEHPSGLPPHGHRRCNPFLLQIPQQGLPKKVVADFGH